MEKKMITEFNKLISHGTESQKDKYKIRKKSILMNPSRRSIYEYLCLHPCSLVSTIAKGLRMKESSVRWHLDKLVYQRFVTVWENGSTVFYPTRMIDPDHVSLFRLMALSKSIDIISLIKSKEGVHQNEIGRELDINIRTAMKYLTDLEDLGLIRSANDGKYKRFYLTKMMDDLRDFYRKNSKNFKEYLVQKARQDGLRPKVLLSSPELLKLKLDLGTEIRVLTIPMIPYSKDVYGLKNPKKKKIVSKLEPFPKNLPLS
jgi:DNA-binding MarR family transcriptional regulator